MAGSLYLADSNILIRLVNGDHPEYPLVRGAVSALREKGVKLGYTLQNMAEFWNASTRPKERNGFGFFFRCHCCGQLGTGANFTIMQP